MWNPIGIAFFLVFWGYLLGYPLMQAYTLIRGRGGARLVAVACLIFGLPFYLWSLSRTFGPQSSGDLSGVLIFFLGPCFLLVLGLLTSVVAAQVRREQSNHAARNPDAAAASE